jgi:hypothetical protein
MDCKNKATLDSGIIAFLVSAIVSFVVYELLSICSAYFFPMIDTFNVVLFFAFLIGVIVFFVIWVFYGSYLFSKCGDRSGLL